MMFDTIKRFKIFIIMLLFVFTVNIAAPAPVYAAFGLDEVGKAFKSLGDGAKNIVSSVTDGIKDVVSNVGDGIKNVASSIAEGIGDVVDKAKEIVNIVKTTIKGAIDSATDMGKQIAGTIKETGDEIKKEVGQTVKEVGDNLKQAGSEFKSDVDKAKAAVKADIEAKINKGITSVKDYVSGAKNNFKEFTEMVEDFKAKGIDIVKEAEKELDQKIVNPVLSRLETETKKAKEGIKQASSDFKNVFAAGSKKAPEGFDLAGDALKNYLKADSKSIEFMSGLKDFSTDSQSGKVAASLGGAYVKTTKDLEGQAKNDISVHEKLFDASAWLGPKVSADYKGKFFNDQVTLTAKTENNLGLLLKANGNLKYLKDGALIDAKGKIEAVAGAKTVNDVGLTTNIGGGLGAGTALHVEAMAGADARANGTLYAGKNGIELKGKAEAKCGAWVEGNVNSSVKYKGQDLFGFGAGGGAGLGVGAGVEGGFSFRTNKVGFQDVGFTLGPIKVKGSFYVNPVAISELATDKVKEAVQFVEKKVDSVKDNLKEVGNNIKQVGNDLKKTGESVKDLFGKLWGN